LLSFVAGYIDASWVEVDGRRSGGNDSETVGYVRILPKFRFHNVSFPHGATRMPKIVTLTRQSNRDIVKVSMMMFNLATEYG